jgi:hypothetical protein
MAISRKEKEVPKDLAPARLYLDDLEMVIRVFQEAKESETEKVESQPVLKFELEGQECTELADLPKITEITKNFSMEVTMPGFSAFLRISPHSTYWDTFALEKKEEWFLHSRLEPIFQGRKRLLVAFAHKIPAGLFWLGLGILGTLILFPRLVLYSLPFIESSPTPSVKAPAALVLAVTILWIIHAKLSSSHTIVLLSRYAESSAKRRESSMNKAWDIAKIALGPIVGALVLWFIQHFSHKFLP